MLAGDTDIFGFLPSVAGFSAQHRGFDLLNVKYLLHERQDALLPADRWRLLDTFGEVQLYENLRVQPRAWFVERALSLREAETIQAIRTGTLPDGTPFDVTRVALLARQKTFPTMHSPATVKAIETTPLALSFVTRSTEDGLLVLSEVYYRGWEAHVDSVRVPIERANYALRAVVVPAGEHRVSFRYRPASFYRGLALSLLGVALLLAAHWFVRRKQRSAEFAGYSFSKDRERISQD